MFTLMEDRLLSCAMSKKGQKNMEGMMMIAKLQEESDGEEGRKGGRVHPPHGGFPAKKFTQERSRNNKRKNTDSVETR